MTAAAATPPPQARLIRAFERRLVVARTRALLGRRFASAGAPALVVALLVAALWPGGGPWVVAVVALGIAGDASFAALRERRRLRIALLEAGAEGRGLADMLLAWDEAIERGQSSSRMGSWLAEFLGSEVSKLPDGTERAWARRGLGAARYLVPVAVALLLFWWLRPDVSMPWFGMGGGAAQQSGAYGGGDGGDDGAGGALQPAKPSPPQGAPPEPQRAEPDRPPEGPKPPEQPPAPFLDLPAQAQVVVPEFTRDGPTRRAMAQQALVGVGEGGGAARQQQQVGAGDQQISSPEASRERFERAAEKALQSRRVPERERAIVRSFFEALRGADK